MIKREYKDRAKLFKALAHSVRLPILECLSQDPICVCDMMPHLNQRQAYISQQLSVLRKTRLVRAERIGKCIRYELVKLVIQNV
jgi:DNA-binding transcriptional ArsR family regulator